MFDFKQTISLLLPQIIGVTKRDEPLIIAVAGPVSVGKTTFANILSKELNSSKILLDPLAQTADSSPRKSLVVSSDNFLFSDAQMKQGSISEPRGFPNTYNYEQILAFLWDIKAGLSCEIPQYSHQSYDILQKPQLVPATDILIFEGINALADNPAGKNKLAIRNLADFTIYLDAENAVLLARFLERFKRHLHNAKARTFYYEYAQMPESESLSLAIDTWEKINKINNETFIVPTKKYADAIIDMNS